MFFTTTRYKNTPPKDIFRINITDVDNQYDLYSITFIYVFSVLEGVGFTVTYTSVSGIRYLCIIISIASVEWLLFFLDISNAFQHNVPPKPEGKVYLSLPLLYLEWFKKMAKISISIKKSKRIFPSTHQIYTGKKTFWKFQYDLIKPIFIILKMIRSSYDHSVFS